MKRGAVLALLFIGLLFQLKATHNRAGEIIFKQLSQLTFEVTVITYAIDNLADRDTINLNWGDGSPIQKVFRTNGPIINGIPNGEFLPNVDNTKKNIYGPVLHTFPGALEFYVISMTDPNRIGSIININGGNSVNIKFYLEDTIRIFDPTFIGLNSSPVLHNPPIDNAKINVTFKHNPAAYDPDGDSLYYELIEPFQTTGVPVPLYQYPNEVSPNPDLFTINSSTGEIIWETPQEAGIYNIAILITEYRNGIKLGTLLRDMQIIVKDFIANDPPVISRVIDTCILAGTLLIINVSATDPNTLQTVSLEAFGGPLDMANNPNPAEFTTAGINPVNGVFEWQTVCDHIRRQFYQVVFKATDNYFSGSQLDPLSDSETWIIEIIGPPPENLTAISVDEVIELNWINPYSCDINSTDKFIGFSVWRRECSNPYTPDTCMKGLSGQGYTKITDRLMNTSYTDTSVTRGKNYCYRLVAEFAEKTSFGLIYNKVEGMPSNEFCAELNNDLPLITNVSVLETSTTTGRIFVGWKKPNSGVDGVDTIQNPGPYEYRLMRADGLGNDNPVFIQVAAFNSPTFGGLNDTSYTDTGLDTELQPYAYKIEFYVNGGTFLGASEIASSVFVTLFASDKQITVTWENNVPWTNKYYQVYRADFGSTVYDSITTVGIDSMYLDEDLINDSLYCYYVKSIGGYSFDCVFDSIINLSQQTCAKPLDTIAPCPPVLIVVNDCNDVDEEEYCALDESELKNVLTWTNPNNSCVNDVEKYYIYFKSPLVDSFILIDSILSADDTVYFHSSINGSLAGCYYVTAIDSVENESLPSNEACADNCPCYKLPNVFTPNADGDNDLYVPFLPFRYVDRVDMKIYDRWGVLVFETEDPFLNWDGIGNKSGKQLKEGVYFYVCKVYELRIDGLVESKMILNGYIHLIRGKSD